MNFKKKKAMIIFIVLNISCSSNIVIHLNQFKTIHNIPKSKSIHPFLLPNSYKRLDQLLLCSSVGLRVGRNLFFYYP